jgi:tetratricopeptide (TPR) repeat protein
VPNVSRLREDDRLRLGAVRALVLRDIDTAIDAYRRLAERHPAEAPGWVDLGRAEETASRLQAAADSYARALAIDRQYAAAHMRLAEMQASMGKVNESMAAFDEATRLFQAAGHAEGEAEARMRKAIVLTRRGLYRESRAELDRVIQLAADPRFVHLRTRARFQLARLMTVDGDFSGAETLGRDTVREATDARLNGVAANGLVDMAFTMTLAGQYGPADAHLVRAIELAGNGRARRTEARARLQQASLRLQTGQNEEAIRLSEAPLRFMSEKRYIRPEADGKNILSRAHENLEQYEDAARLAGDVLRLAESIKDETLIATTLDNLAGQLAKQGRLPEALQHRERIEQIHRAQNDHASLAFDIPNRAELLILLGRGDEAAPLLDEVAAQIAAGAQAYRSRRRRVALLRTLLETVAARFDNVAPLAAEAIRLDSPPQPGAKPPDPDSTALMAMMLDEHAKTRLGKAGAAATALQQWTEGATTSPVTRRELRYWAARTLLARGEKAAAHALAVAAWSEAGAKTNAEIRWRLAALAGVAAQGLALVPDSASMLAHSATDRQALEAAWRTHSQRYLARPDLSLLRKSL